MHYVQRTGNSAEERRESEPQGVKQKCGCVTLGKGKYTVFIEGGCGWKETS